jgi:hypothetical protein
MRQRLALVGEEEHDIAGLRLRLAQRQPEADAIDGVGVLAALQRVSRPTPAEFFLRSTLDRRDLEMVPPSRASISPMRRASVQLGRSATGLRAMAPRHSQRRFGLDRRRPRGRARLERFDAGARKVGRNLEVKTERYGRDAIAATIEDSGQGIDPE